MKKGILLFFISIALTLSMFGTAFAAGWRQASDRRWWYAADDSGSAWYAGTQNKPLWVMIDGVYYAFDASGWLYQNTITPDGYYVDSTGAWNGNAKAESEEASGNSLASTISNTFWLDFLQLDVPPDDQIRNFFMKDGKFSAQDNEEGTQIGSGTWTLSGNCLTIHDTQNAAQYVLKVKKKGGLYFLVHSSVVLYQSDNYDEVKENRAYYSSIADSRPSD